MRDKRTPKDVCGEASLSLNLKVANSMLAFIGGRDVIGSNPERDSRFFLVSTLLTVL